MFERVFKMKIINKIFSLTDYIFEKFNILLMATMALAVIVTVFFRYVLNISFIWAEEAILFTFIATTYFGIIICVKEGEHIAIDYFIEKSPLFVKKIITTFISLVSIITLLSLAYLSLGWIETVGSTLSSGIKVAYKYIYIWMPISFTICAIYEVRKYINFMLNKDLGTNNNELGKEV
jgi:TRAP-type C4-dicarboxylate transport system permease small subunit